MSAKIVENCSKAIERAQKLRALNIFIKETFESAQAKAVEYQNAKLNRKLEGKLMTIKDNFCTKDAPTTCGSKMLESYAPPFNATVVDRLNEAGAIMMGKVNMDEFGMGSSSTSFYGTVKNPWNLKMKKTLEDLSSNHNNYYISGGSSGGSAASVVADIAEFSIGSDTGGSVRNPAALCGCIGYKPTYGLISRYGLIPLNNYFDTVGILSKSMQTLVNVLNVIAGPDRRDSTMIKNKYEEIKLRDDFKTDDIVIGIPKEFYPAGLSMNNYSAWEKAIEVFSKKGNVKFLEISLPHVQYSMSCYSILTSCEVASNFARYDGIKFGHREANKEQGTQSLDSLLKNTRNSGFGEVVKGRIVSGNFFLLKENYEKYFTKAQKIRTLIKEDFDRAFSLGVDLIVTPTNYHDTFTYEDFKSQAQIFDETEFFTTCANVAGVPAISLPSTLSDIGLPVGVQFIGNCEKDELLLNVANWFMKANNNYEYLNIDSYLK